MKTGGASCVTAETLGRPHVVIQEIDPLGERSIDAVAEATVNVLGSWPSGLDRSAGGRPFEVAHRWREWRYLEA
jgi:hypothetical protein